MKELIIAVDGREIFQGTVAEITWNETPETVTVTGRFEPSPSILQSLQALAKQNKPEPAAVQASEPSGSVGRPTLDVVRGDPE